MGLMSDHDLIDRIFEHVDNNTTDMGDDVWREPVENYSSIERFNAEVALMRRLPIPFCPSAALPEPGSYIARTAAKTPLLVVRGTDGVVRAFRNACRHRGMAVASGEGCKHSFVCPYHAWTYGLDGKLKHIAGTEGFPGIDKEDHGLVPVKAEERGGLIFITQDAPVSEGALESLPELVGPGQVVFDAVSFMDDANWKLIGETSMEGYHIKALHNKSFYPYGFDNLNIVETDGMNARVVFPFRRIEKLRKIPRAERRLKGMVTDVYQLFPNSHVSVLSNHSILIILEPVSPTQTEWVIYKIMDKPADGSELDIEQARKDAGFVQDTGLVEDRQAAASIQAGLETNANTHFTFGRYEKAICNFHKNLTAHLAML